MNGEEAGTLPPHTLKCPSVVVPSGVKKRFLSETTGCSTSSGMVVSGSSDNINHMME